MKINVVNEHHLMRKSHDATQKKCPHVVHFNVPRDWFEINLWHQKRYSEGGRKNRGCHGLLGRVIVLATLLDRLPESDKLARNGFFFIEMNVKSISTTLIINVSTTRK